MLSIRKTHCYPILIHIMGSCFVYKMHRPCRFASQMMLPCIAPSRFPAATRFRSHNNIPGLPPSRRQHHWSALVIWYHYCARQLGKYPGDHLREPRINR